LLKRTERSLIHNKLAVVDDALITRSFNSRTRRTFSSLKAKAIADRQGGYVIGAHREIP